MNLVQKMTHFGLSIIGISLASCTNKINASLQIDGSPFRAASCRAGISQGFSGVDFYGQDGTLLRLVYLPTGQTKAILKKPGAPTGEEMGICGTLSLQQQSSRINGIQNHKGFATLECSSPEDCTSEKHSIKGTISFENCH